MKKTNAITLTNSKGLDGFSIQYMHDYCLRIGMIVYKQYTTSGACENNIKVQLHHTIERNDEGQTVCKRD